MSLVTDKGEWPVSRSYRCTSTTKWNEILRV